MRTCSFDYYGLCLAKGCFARTEKCHSMHWTEDGKSLYPTYAEGTLQVANHMRELYEAQQQEIERIRDENVSIRNWNACEEEEHLRLIESDKRRILLEEEVEQLQTRLADVKFYVEAIMRDRNEMDKVFLHADTILSGILKKAGEVRTQAVWQKNRELQQEIESLRKRNRR